MVAHVFVDTEPIFDDRRSGKIRHDDRHVPRPTYHRIRFVRPALKRCSRVRVNIGDHRYIFLSTDSPEFSERVTLKDTHASCVGIGIEVIIKNRFYDFASTSTLDSEQKCARLMPAPSPPL
jgi:hypothetical protein